MKTNLLPYGFAFHVHELVNRGFHGIVRLGVFGVLLTPFCTLNLMFDPPIDTPCQHRRILHREQRFAQQRKLAGRR